MNVGGGAGSYEPQDRAVIAVEPSETMIAQRPSHAAPVVRGVAQALPFADKSFDAASAFLTVHHWPDKIAGLREMARVARKRCVFFTWIPPETEFWLARDYIPEITSKTRDDFTLDYFREAFGDIDVRTVMVPQDCTDGFLCAYWKRPEFYLDPAVRLSMSILSMVADPTVALERLASDIADGTWARRNAELMDHTEMDYGYRIIIAEQGR